ncbi:unnamed protein product [marine sediment metagenome]|uniref:Uncharacterized protein n=1 Tax=marine sediment metagenome TaxID=412755 RepID=X0VGP1_9ZZZZ
MSSNFLKYLTTDIESLQQQLKIMDSGYDNRSLDSGYDNSSSDGYMICEYCGENADDNLKTIIDNETCYFCSMKCFEKIDIR